MLKHLRLLVLEETKKIFWRKIPLNLSRCTAIDNNAHAIQCWTFRHTVDFFNGDFLERLANIKLGIKKHFLSEAQSDENFYDLFMFSFLWLLSFFFVRAVFYLLHYNFSFLPAACCLSVVAASIRKSCSTFASIDNNFCFCCFFGKLNRRNLLSR